MGHVVPNGPRRPSTPPGAVAQIASVTAPTARTVSRTGPCRSGGPLTEIGTSPIPNAYTITNRPGSIAGGIGLAPLRPVVLRALERSAQPVVLYGARTPGDLLYVEEVERWRSVATVDTTVDAAERGWGGKVGVVPQLVPAAPFDGATALAYVCGPEIMMRFAAQALLDRGLTPDRIIVSLERNMRCGVGHCGHCQLGPTLICRDGPVYTYETARPWLEVREL